MTSDIKLPPPQPFSLSEVARIMDLLQRAEDFARVRLIFLQQFCLMAQADISALISWNSSVDFHLKCEEIYPPNALDGLQHLSHMDQNVLQELLAQEFILVNSVQPEQDKDLLELLKLNHASSLVLLPIQLDGISTGGVLLMRKENQPEFLPKEILVMQLVLQIFAIFMHSLQSAEKALQRANELESVLQANTSLTSSLNLEEVLDAILCNALDLIPEANDAHIFLYENQKLSFGAALFRDGSKGKVWAEPRENGLTYHVARGGKMIVVPDMRTHELFQDVSSFWEGAIVGLPLKIHERVVGVMTLAMLQPWEFDQPELELLSLLGDQAAISIENARIHKLISQQALTDLLTKLPNRRALEREFDRLKEYSDRYHHPFVFMLLDLNGFKRVNDTYGHAVGDEALRRVAETMQKAIRKTDSLFRFGGDEFVLLLPETTYELANHVGEKIQEEVSGCVIPVGNGATTAVSVSFGTAQYPDEAVTADALAKLADLKLYEVKRQWGKSSMPDAGNLDWFTE